MKFLSLMFVLGMAVTTSHAQANLLGKSETEVKEKMQTMTNVHMITQMPAMDGSYELQYVDDSMVYMIYFFKADKCSLYRVVYPNKDLPEIIKEMNTDNVRVNNSTWTAKNLRYKVTLITDVPVKNSFYLEFESI